ncbi:hypothetical protein CN918_32305 [Priestia megaterium]|nr:hypothetical protein CN918_32305 [Priestia megaterium]
MTFTPEKYLQFVPQEEQERVSLYSEEFTAFLANQRFGTKNKRTKKKLVKEALNRLPSLPKQPTSSSSVHRKVNKANVNEAEDVTTTFDFSQLPVSFILKAGKQYFQEEKVFRFYYNQNHPEYYKNKEVLVSQFELLINRATPDISKEIQPLIQEQLSN